MQKKISMLLVMLLCAALLLTGCTEETDATVSVQSVAMITGVGSVGLADRFAGVVEAGQTVKLEKDPDMQLKEIHVSAGDMVSVGDLLFSYDTEAITIEQEKKELDIEQTKAAIDTKTAQIEELEKEKSKAPASRQLDYTLQIQELQIDVAESELSLKSKERELERIQQLLENTEVRSEVQGCVQSINENGGYDDYGNPKPFMTIAETGVFRVKGKINEQNIMSLPEGTPVIIRSRANGEQTWAGFVSMIDYDNPVSDNSGMYYNGYDKGETQASKYPFYVTLDSDEGLMLGQHVYIEPGAEQELPQGLYLPEWFICDVDSSPWVWAANSKDRLEKRSVTLGEYNEEQAAYLITDGLSEDDYIAFPDENCVEGAKTVPYDESDFNSPVPENNGAAIDFGEGEYYGEDDAFYEGDGMSAIDGDYEGMEEDYVEDVPAADDGVPVFNGAVVPAG